MVWRSRRGADMLYEGAEQLQGRVGVARRGAGRDVKASGAARRGAVKRSGWVSLWLLWLALSSLWLLVVRISYCKLLETRRMHFMKSV